MQNEDKHIRNSWKYFGFELSKNWQYAHAMFEIETRNSSKNVGVTIAIPYVCYLFVKFAFPFFKPRKDYKEYNIFSLSFHGGSIWWEVWHPQGEWKSGTPKWRHGNFNFANTFMGEAEYRCEILEEHDVLIPMPERSYRAKAQLELAIWERPIGPTTKMLRVQITMEDGEQIPHPGKGENSWDCGDDATFSMCTPAKTIAEGVGHMVGSVLASRVKYGGHAKWNWLKEKEEEKKTDEEIFDDECVPQIKNKCDLYDDEIEVLPELPVIFTKDKEWLGEYRQYAKPGQVFLLPDDAVLAMCPQNVEMKQSEDDRARMLKALGIEQGEEGIR